jgi:general bacterial porin, GBP family
MSAKTRLNPLINRFGLATGAFAIAVSAPAMALDIQIYGGVDIGLSYVNVSRGPINGDAGAKGSQLAMDSSELDDSMFGIKGADDLGSGWKAMFNLAAEITAPSGEMTYDEYFGIESTLGVSNNRYGSLQFGRQQTISTDFFTSIDPLGLSFGQANMGTSFTAINTQIYNDMVQYTSPTWSGLQFGIGYSFNTGDYALYADSGSLEQTGSNNGFGTMEKMRALSAAIQYKTGPLLAVASYDTAYASSVISDSSDPGRTVPNANASDPQAWYFGLAYTVGDVVLSGAWGRGINGALSGSGPGGDVGGSPLPSLTGKANILFSQGFNHNSYLLGFSWAVNDRTQLMASWQMLKPDGDLAQISYTGTQQILGAAVTYNFSARTTAYIWASYGDNFQMLQGAKTSVIGTGIQTLF